MELQKLLGQERELTAELRKEMQQMKKYHIEEMAKAEKAQQVKYKQLRGLID